MAWHEEGHFESFAKLCAATNHAIDEHFTNTVLAHGKQTDYHIDVVTVKYFPSLILTIAQETRKIAKRAKKERSALYEAIDDMAKSAKRNADALQNIIRPSRP